MFGCIGSTHFGWVSLKMFEEIPQPNFPSPKFIKEGLEIFWECILENAFLLKCILENAFLLKCILENTFSRMHFAENSAFGKILKLFIRSDYAERKCVWLVF
jgi:hypothetical protein